MSCSAREGLMLKYSFIDPNKHFQQISIDTDNLFYTDAQYSDIICYNDNLIVTKALLKGDNYARILYLTL